MTALLLGLLLSADGVAPMPHQAVFALVVGVNAGVDRELEALHYADDDAAQYQSLFRLVGARTYLLSRLDENTRRLHPQAAAEALPPTGAELDHTVAQLAEDVSRARAQGIETVLYFVFAGHGSVRDGRGYLALEDDRLTGEALEARVVAKVPADTVHLIIDACYSSYLVYGRGPGGERRPIAGFVDQPALLRDKRVGFLLSTSSARESHEWEGFQAGVFSHEVRSGLMGAADLDGDGRVSYREIAAFVERANAAIPNERFRPDVLARPPAGSAEIFDLRAALERRLDVDGSSGDHYRLEDAQGVRLLDFHSPKDQRLHLLRPAPGPLYLRDEDTQAELTVDAAPDVVALSQLSPAAARDRPRGAAANAFALAFSVAFDQQAVDYYEWGTPAEPAPEVRQGAPVREWVGGGLAVAAVCALAGGIAMSAEASSLHGSLPAGAPQLEASALNGQIGAENRDAALLYSVGAAALVGGAVLLFWPRLAGPDGWFHF